MMNLMAYSVAVFGVVSIAIVFGYLAYEEHRFKRMME